MLDVENVKTISKNKPKWLWKTVMQKQHVQVAKESLPHNPQCQSERKQKQNDLWVVTGNVSKRGNNLSGKINNDKLFSGSMNGDKKRALSVSTGSISAAWILTDASAVTDERPTVSEVKVSGGALMGSALWLQSPTFNERCHKSRPAWEKSAKTTGTAACDRPFPTRLFIASRIHIIQQFNSSLSKRVSWVFHGWLWRVCHCFFPLGLCKGSEV